MTKYEELQDQIREMENNYVIDNSDRAIMQDLFNQNITYLTGESWGADDESDDKENWSDLKKIEVIAAELDWKYWNKDHTLTKEDIIECATRLFHGCMNKAASWMKSGGVLVKTNCITKEVSVTFELADVTHYWKDDEIRAM